jgi:hypothetical protein
MNLYPKLLDVAHKRLFANLPTLQFKFKFPEAYSAGQIDTSSQSIIQKKLFRYRTFRKRLS